MIKSGLLGLFLLVSMFTTRIGFSQVVVNEGSNKNYSQVTDEDGDSDDWIELYNAGSSPVNLAGYSLTDNQSNPQKWIFPPRILAPGEYLIVFCSGKNRLETSPFTNVSFISGFVPSVGWNLHSFTTPFAWDGVSNILINTCSYSNTGYISNSVFNQSQLSYASTLFTYNDGNDNSCYAANGEVSSSRPVVRINGIQIGTADIQNNTTSYPAPYGNWYWSSRHQFLFRASELQAAGLTAGNFNSLEFDVTYTDSVNYTYVDVSINHTQLTDITNSFTQSVGTNFHTNFTISSLGETIYLFNPTQQLVSSLYIHAETYDVSTGLLPDAGTDTVWFQPATPGSSNNSSTPYTSIALSPTFNLQGGVYSTFQTTGITDQNIASDSARVFYTTNGNDPDTNSTLYTGTSIPLFYSTVVKARAYVSGKLPSPISSTTYLLNANHVTPIISVTTDNSNLFGPSGIFDNYNQDWLRPAYVEYYDSATNYRRMSQPSGMIMDGGAGGSRWQPQKSFRLELANGVLGENPLIHQVIPTIGRNRYSDFYIRNGSNQYNLLPYKDAALVRMLGQGTYNYYSAWRPVTVYLNGNYWGLYELREKLNAEKFRLLDNADPSTIELLSQSYFYGGMLRAIQGSTENFWNSTDSLELLSTSDSLYWDKANQYFDLQNYCDYIAAESWVGNTDWPYNNIRIQRSNGSNFRWRFVLQDVELSLAPNGWTDCNFNGIQHLLNSDWSPFVHPWNKGMQNPKFKAYFINRYADLMNEFYREDRLLDIEQQCFDLTISEMQNQYQRWGDPNNIGGQITDYYNNHLTFREQLQCRNEQVRQQIVSTLQLPRQVKVTLDVVPAQTGRIAISTLQPDNYPWDGIYFDGVPVRLEAIANMDYEFSHWELNSLLSDTTNSLYNDTLQTDSVVFRAHFKKIPGVGVQTFGNESCKIYPNPASDRVYIEGSWKSGDRIRLTDMCGRVRLDMLATTGNKMVLDVRGLTEGIYLLDVGGRVGKLVVGR
jgi:hypothetical protein